MASNKGGDMDGPERAAEGGIAEPVPLGEDCKLRGVSLRCKEGDLRRSPWLRALPNDEALCNADSSVDGYRAYCWTIICDAPTSFRLTRSVGSIVTGGVVSIESSVGSSTSDRNVKETGTAKPSNHRSRRTRYRHRSHSQQTDQTRR